MEYLEILDTVNKELIIKNTGLKITEDSLILAENIKKNIVKSNETVKMLEIGAGQGIISVLLSEIKNVEIYAVEIQDKIFKCLVENIKKNNLEKKIIPLNKDIKEVEGEYGIIFSNPPYRKLNSGRLPENEEKFISQYEKMLTLEELFSNIKRLLKNGGYFFVIIPDKRLNDVFSYIYKNSLNIVSIQINKYRKIKLIVIFGKKGGKKHSGINIEIIKKS